MPVYLQSTIWIVNMYVNRKRSGKFTFQIQKAVF